MCGINRISFEELRKAPVSIRVLYVVMTLLAVTGLVLIMIDIFAVGRDCLTIAMVCIVAAQIIYMFGVCRYAGKLHGGEDR